jgi:hypothetical protein
MGKPVTQVFKFPLIASSFLFLGQPRYAFDHIVNSSLRRISRVVSNPGQTITASISMARSMALLFFILAAKEVCVEDV